VGISPEARALIFDRLYQDPESVDNNRSGLGLGLFICRELIRLHHGNITVASEPGHGSTFTFSVPLYSLAKLLSPVVAYQGSLRPAFVLVQVDLKAHKTKAGDDFYKVNPNETGIQKLADLIEQGSGQIRNAVKELRNMRDMRKITDALVKVNNIENQADDIFDMSIDRLFETEPDAKEVIKKREIYQVMEIVTDKCEDATNVIESIIIKYA